MALLTALTRSGGGPGRRGSRLRRGSGLVEPRGAGPVVAGDSLDGLPGGWALLGRRSDWSGGLPEQIEGVPLVAGSRQLAAVRKGTVGLVVVLLVGSVLLSVAGWLRQPAAGAVPVRVSSGAAVDSIGPSAYAAAYIRAWLTGGLTATGMPNVDLSVWGPPVQLVSPAGIRRVDSVQVAEVEQVGPGYWSVTVAAAVAALVRGRWSAPAPHWYQTAVLAQVVPAAAVTPTPVPSSVAAGSVPVGQAAFRATVLPHEVAGPMVAAPAQLAADTDVPVTGATVALTVTAFLRSYLTGQDITRLVSPTTAMTPPAGSGVISVAVSSLTATAAGEAIASSTVVPADRTRVQVVAVVAAVDRAGPVNPATYAMQLTARAGRWEISALDSAPALSTLSAGGVASPGAPAPTGQPSG